MSYRIQKKPYRKPIKAPYELVYVATKDNDVFVFKPINKVTRMCLPADYANNKLYLWNQKRALEYANPWQGTYASDSRFGFLGTTIINSGDSIVFHRKDNYKEIDEIEPKLSYAWGWSHDKTNHKFSYEFYLNNNREESNPSLTDGQSDSNEACIYDDDESFWSIRRGGTGSYDIQLSEETVEVQKGNSSQKMEIITGSYSWMGVQHTYASEQDWSGYDFLCFWIYGVNTGLTISVEIFAPDDQNWFYYQFTDNFNGWKRIVIPLRKFTASGSPDWSKVTMISIVYLSVDQTFTSYLDRIVVDVGQWVKVEVFVPDQLKVGSSIRSWRVFSWDGSAWTTDGFLDVFDAGTQDNLSNCYSGNLYFLDGTTQYDVTQDYRKGASAFLVGNRGETKSLEGSAENMDSDAGTITYSSYYGCLKRIGFAIKLPPDDGQDSSTNGISQCKLKLEVYYEGDLTVKDTMGNKNGTRYGGLQVVTPYGYGLSLNGSSNYVSTLFNPNSEIGNGNSFSVGFRVYPENVTDFLAVLGCFVTTPSTSRFYFQVNEGQWVWGYGSEYDLNTNVTADANTWQYILFVYDATTNTIKIYKNGSEAYSTTYSGDGTLPSLPVFLGVTNDGGSPEAGHYFDGVIAEIRVWNRALTSTEAQSVSNGQKVTDGLIAEWLFEDDYDFGRTTYEFEDSTNQYYGLQNINDSWICLFDASSKNIEFLILSNRPTGLKVRADENEEIDRIELTLPKGTKVYIGELIHSDLTRDRDSDGVPDFLEEGLG
ncbi:MAG: hypothetical protein DRP11_02125 [Candidatus Aenigmatarchaeota archaeon]|nr:MAG: hypothetical protein DRP11_02125 [Candidatus Aenigmarchaeota archaeon]